MASCSRSCARSFPEPRSCSASCSRSASPSQFGELSDTQRYVYYVTLLSTAAALVFFLAPAAYHRVRFRAGDKEYMVRKGNREAIAGSVAISIAFTGVIYLVTDLVFGTVQAIAVAAGFFALIAWLWWGIALYRAWQDRREAV